MKNMLTLRQRRPGLATKAKPAIVYRVHVVHNVHESHFRGSPKSTSIANECFKEKRKRREKKTQKKTKRKCTLANRTAPMARSAIPRKNHLPPKAGEKTWAKSWPSPMTGRVSKEASRRPTTATSGEGSAPTIPAQGCRISKVDSPTRRTRLHTAGLDARLRGKPPTTTTHKKKTKNRGLPIPLNKQAPVPAPRRGPLIHLPRTIPQNSRGKRRSPQEGRFRSPLQQKQKRHRLLFVLCEIPM